MHVVHIRPFEAKSITIYPPFPETAKTFQDVTVLMMTAGFVDFTYDRHDGAADTVHHRDCFSGPYHVEAGITESVYDSPANRGV